MCYYFYIMLTKTCNDCGYKWIAGHPEYRCMCLPCLEVSSKTAEKLDCGCDLEVGHLCDYHGQQKLLYDIKAQIRRTRKEMRLKGIKRTSCFNGGLSGEVYSYNARMFELETQLEAAQKITSPEPKP